MRISSQKTATNLTLKFAIIETGRTQREIAQRAGMSELRLSQIVTGRIPPTVEDKRALAKTLRRTQASLFPEPQAVAS